MRDPSTTISLIVLTALSLGACVLALIRLMKPASANTRRYVYSLLGSCTLGCIGLFAYRAVVVHRGWQPLQSHADGLLLIASLFAVAVLFLQSRGGLDGLVTFALPLLTLILAWAVCASAWTFHLFQIDSVWQSVHLAGVYLGTLLFSIAAIAGGMYLFARYRLRHRVSPDPSERLASLETIERLIVAASAVGFSLLTVGLAASLVIVASGPTRLGTGWWYSPKVITAIAVWLIYALVMNARYTTKFRGARAAWLSIIALVLLMATFGIAHMLPSTSDTDTAATPPADTLNAKEAH